MYSYLEIKASAILSNISLISTNRKRVYKLWVWLRRSNNRRKHAALIFLTFSLMHLPFDILRTGYSLEHSKNLTFSEPDVNDQVRIGVKEWPKSVI